ncbi:TPA: hypothetical protein N0F65_005350 [Lagenidium giganteum]|uniref:ATP-dependent DNA helicase n=1 Tax=Lagenidium giganteum TaxID=4803 RepID=A0AAV2YXU7_9STRA|nr:TPA: hypothetical protein N0F65_005350 [Lagenidium giganteum]
MTLNKSQGQTLDTVGLYIPNQLFEYGQLYMALSRTRTAPSGIICFGECGTMYSPAYFITRMEYLDASSGVSGRAVRQWHAMCKRVGHVLPSQRPKPSSHPVQLLEFANDYVKTNPWFYVEELKAALHASFPEQKKELKQQMAVDLFVDDTRDLAVARVLWPLLGFDVANV